MARWVVSLEAVSSYLVTVSYTAALTFCGRTGSDVNAVLGKISPSPQMF